MSEIKHTPEPWSWSGMGRIRAGNKIIADIWNADNGYISDEEVASARRIVACVNACAGMSTEQLEKGAPGWLAMSPTYAEAVEHRDELLRAAKDVVTLCDEDSSVVGSFVQNKLRTLIAEIEESK